MAVVREQFEGGSEGAAITTANAPALDLVAGSPTFSNTTAAHGSLSAYVNAPFELFGINAADGTVAWTFYIRWASLPSVNSTVFSVYTSGTLSTSVVLTTAGRLWTYDQSSTQIGTASTILSTDTWYRVEGYTVKGTGASDGTISWAFYEGDSGSAIHSGSSTSCNTGTADFAACRFGPQTGGATIAVYLDDIAIEAGSTTPPGVPVTDNATYDLTITHDTDSAAIADRTYEIDATASVGTVSLTQTSGTTASDTESPTGVFTFADPGGTDDLVFDLDAGTDTIEITIPRGTTTTPAILTFTGGTVTDMANWG